MFTNNSSENGLSVLPEDSLFKQKMLQNDMSKPSGDYLSQMMNNDSFLPGFLAKNLGRWMKVESIVGGNLITKIGQLIKVGAGFIVLKLNTNPVSSVVCEMSSIRFVTILYSGKIKE